MDVDERVEPGTGLQYEPEPQGEDRATIARASVQPTSGVSTLTNILMSYNEHYDTYKIILYRITHITIPEFRVSAGFKQFKIVITDGHAREYYILKRYSEFETLNGMFSDIKSPFPPKLWSETYDKTGYRRSSLELWLNEVCNKHYNSSYVCDFLGRNNIRNIPHPHYDLHKIISIVKHSESGAQGDMVLVTYNNGTQVLFKIFPDAADASLEYHNVNELKTMLMAQKSHNDSNCYEFIIDYFYTASLNSNIVVMPFIGTMQSGDISDLLSIKTKIEQKCKDELASNIGVSKCIKIETVQITKGILLGGTGSMEIITQMIEAIFCLHSVNFYHCDIKPGNFLITSKEDGRYMVYIIDFGTSVSQSQINDIDTAKGTADYLSPFMWDHIDENKNMKESWRVLPDTEKMNCLKANDKWQLLLTIVAFSIGRPKPGWQPYYKSSLTRLLVGKKREFGFTEVIKTKDKITVSDLDCPGWVKIVLFTFVFNLRNMTVIQFNTLIDKLLGYTSDVGKGVKKNKRTKKYKMSKKPKKYKKRSKKYKVKKSKKPKKSKRKTCRKR